MSKLGHEDLFWRRLAHWGASRGPDWWVRVSPPFFGAAAAAVVPQARRAVVRNLRRIHGRRAPADEARDVLATFATYASCFAETLSNDAPSGPKRPRATIFGELHIRRALGAGRGVVMVTAHTAGWEAVGPLLAKDYHLPFLLVMAPEPDDRARAISDEARRRSGVAIAHVGDPLASLPLLRHVREGGIVGLQLDRAAPGMRMRDVEVLGAPGAIPEGPLRLAQLTGAPLLPIFCAREGHRRYAVHACEPRWIDRRATGADLDAAAQNLADEMTRFLRAHPTQWFHWA
ncbi:MAG TPA: lysophospholipid acyltransferase family protein [Labilithrix sp.]